jgi:NADH-quinone oxidoreductase subunit N
MNAIILSAVWGVVMMFSGVFSNRPATIRVLAVSGMVVLILANTMDLAGYHFFPFDTHNMLYFDSFGLVFNDIAFISTLLYFLLSADDMERVGIYSGE